MYYIDKAKQFLYNDSNVNRIYYLNNTLMACLLEIGNYEECYQITKKQLLSLASIELNNEFIKRTSNKNKILALLGMEKYQSIIDILGNQTKISRTELVSLLVVNLKIDKINNTKRSEVVLNNIKESDFDEDFLYVIELIIQYLNKPNDKLYNKIKSYPHISRCFYIILKNIVTK